MSARPTPPPRTASTFSGASVPLSRGTTLGSASSDVERKKRSHNLLRDYYGAPGAEDMNTLDIDLPETFNPSLYFAALSASASLPSLLQRENELLMEIRELDGERQSLVYNHHHELIEASDTIRKMKSRALQLDSSLDSLKASFQSISQLSAALAPQPSEASLETPRASEFPRGGLMMTPKSARSMASEQEARDRELETETTPGRTRARSESVTSTVPTFDPLLHLPPLLALPILIRSLLASPPQGSTSIPVAQRPRASSTATLPESSTRAQAERIWGSFEPILRCWEDEGVLGVKEIGGACREALRAGRRNSIGAGRSSSS